MEYRDWHILQTLFREQNITKTAEALYISQPALTKRLRQIEKDFGVQIVQRGSRGVQFTPKANIWQNAQMRCCCGCATSRKTC